MSSTTDTPTPPIKPENSPEEAVMQSIVQGTLEINDIRNEISLLRVQTAMLMDTLVMMGGEIDED